MQRGCYLNNTQPDRIRNQFKFQTINYHTYVQLIANESNRNAEKNIPYKTSILV